MTLTATTAFVPNGSPVIDGETVSRRVDLPYVGRHQTAPTGRLTAFLDVTAEKIDTMFTAIDARITATVVAPAKNFLRRTGQFLKASPARVSHKIHDALSARLTARQERHSAEECKCDFRPAAFQKEINASMERVRAAQLALSRARIIARTPTVATSRMAYTTAA